MSRARLTAALLLVLAGRAAPARAALTEAPRLAAVYDTILDARFDRVEAELARACPPAPLEACAALRAVAVWWRIQIAPEDRTLDDRLNEAAAEAIRLAEAWTRREPNRGEAWFYLAGSYGPLVEWRALRGQRLAAARDGGRIKEALERALALDPSIEDAHFGIGLYHYYADVAPAALKLLRWLLLLPGGNRMQGLREMEEARTRGALLTGEADYQLHFIYLWYEHQPQRALDLLESLDRRHPTNPLFLRRIAEVQEQYLHDRRASAASWQRLLDRARAGQTYDAHGVARRARGALARLGAPAEGKNF